MFFAKNIRCAFWALVLFTACSSPTNSSDDADLTNNSSDVYDAGVRIDVGTAEPGGFQVNVINGFGSGRYEAGAVVHIWADHNPRTQVVANWSGDGDLLNDSGEWHTSFTMPSRNVTLTAELTNTSFEIIEEQFDGRDRSKAVRYFIPPDPVGFVHITHGTGGSGAIIEGIEAGYIARVLSNAGYGVWATDAEEVDAGDQDGNNAVRWDVSPGPDNVDFANLTRIVGQFIDRQLIPDDIPNFIVGMSNGGAFSLVSGSTLNLNAAVVYCAAGPGQVAAATTTPTAWFLCEQDDNEQVDNEKSTRNHEALAARNIATELYTQGPSPLYNQRFARIEGIDEATSRNIADELRLNGHVDEHDFLLEDGNEIAVTIASAPNKYPVISSLQPERNAREVIQQLRIMRSNHRIYDDYARRTLAFIQAHTP